MKELIAKAVKGDARAQVKLAVRYRDDRGVAQDIPKALEIWQQAAASGNGRAASPSVFVCLAGDGVPPDPKEAPKLAPRAAELNDPSGLIVLGEM